MKSHLVGFYTSRRLFQGGCCSICAFHGDVKVFVPSCAGCVLAWLVLIIRWFPTITSNQQEELLMVRTGSAFIVQLSVLVLVSVIQVKYSVLTEVPIRQLSEPLPDGWTPHPIFEGEASQNKEIKPAVPLTPTRGSSNDGSPHRLPC